MTRLLASIAPPVRLIRLAYKRWQLSHLNPMAPADQLFGLVLEINELSRRTS